MVTKRNTILKCLSTPSPGNFDFFFQNQSTFGVKNLLYYRYNRGFPFLSYGRGLENLPTNRRSLDFCVLSKKVFINKDFPRARLLIHAHTPRFNRLFFNRKFLRKKSELRIVNRAFRRPLWLNGKRS